MGIEGGEGSLRPGRGVLLARRCLGAQPGCLEGKQGHPSKIPPPHVIELLAVTIQCSVSCSEQGISVLFCGIVQPCRMDGPGRCTRPGGAGRLR